LRDPLGDTRADARRIVLTIALIVGGVAVFGLFKPRVLGTVAVLFSIPVVIIAHEFGHFIMAKRADMKVTEFFLGFGPRLWSVRRGETEYGVKAFFPLGGYVRIIGMTNVEEVDPADEPRTYRQKAYRHRLGVAVAGSAVHFLIAGSLLFIIYGFVGEPSARPVVSQIVEDSPAARSDFRLGDRIVAVDGHPVKDWDEIPEYVRPRGEQRLVFTVERDGRRLDIPLVPQERKVEGGRTVGFVGLGPQEYLRTRSLPEALGGAAIDTPRAAKEAVVALGSMFSPSGVRNYGEVLTGQEGSDPNHRFVSPVGVARLAGEAVNIGLRAVLILIFVINVFVGVFNMVPLLPLDGGHVAIATYEKIASMITRRRVQVDVARLLPITAAVVAVLVVIGISALYLDIVRPLAP
jgi:membrane-associated protease RseP (regulator of RpoE activity)